MYQEPFLGSDQSYNRNCSERYSLIKKHSSPGKDWMDIGCAEGYFSLRLAYEKHTKTVQAFDIDPIALSLGRQTKEKYNIPNVKFSEVKISPKILSDFDFVDYTIFLSTAHLIALYNSYEYMLNFVRSIKSQVLFFEMGHSKEKAPWIKALPDMGSNPDIFISNMLNSCGWRNILRLGSFIGPRDHDCSRTIFRCEK